MFSDLVGLPATVLVVIPHTLISTEISTNTSKGPPGWSNDYYAPGYGAVITAMPKTFDTI